jgi:hypothetical protein
LFFVNAREIKLDDNSLGPPLTDEDLKYLPESEIKFLEQYNRRTDADSDLEAVQRLVPIFADANQEVKTNKNEQDASIEQDLKESKETSKQNRGGSKSIPDNPSKADSENNQDKQESVDPSDKEDDTMDNNSKRQRIVPIFSSGKGIGSKNRGAIADPRARWGNCQVPYTIGKEYGKRDRAVIKAAMTQFAKDTGIKWVPRSGKDKNFVAIANQGPNKCYAEIGIRRNPGPQDLALGETEMGCLSDTGGMFDNSKFDNSKVS